MFCESRTLQEKQPKHIKMKAICHNYCLRHAVILFLPGWRGLLISPNKRAVAVARELIQAGKGDMCGVEINTFSPHWLEHPIQMRLSHSGDNGAAIKMAPKYSDRGWKRERIN